MNRDHTTMYVATLILFLLPLSLLAAAWRSLKSSNGTWRLHSLTAAVVLGTLATLTSMVFWLSWTHSGGSPHGLMPLPGLWLKIRPLAEVSVLATIAVGALGKGKGRLFIIACALSIVLVVFLLGVGEMD
jgi:hypothetical protein